MAQPSSSSGDWPAARRRLVPHVQPQAAQPKPQRDGCSRPTPSDRTPESARATPSRKRLKVSPSSAPAKAADFKTLSLSPGGTARSAQRFNTLDLARELSLTPEKTPSTAARAACNSRRWAHSDPLTGSNSCACAQPYLGSEPLPLAGVGLLHSENQSKTRSPAAPAGSQSRQVAVMLQAAAVGSNPMQNAPSPASEAAQQECGPDGSVRTVHRPSRPMPMCCPLETAFPPPNSRGASPLLKQRRLQRRHSRWIQMLWRSTYVRSRSQPPRPCSARFLLQTRAARLCSHLRPQIQSHCDSHTTAHQLHSTCSCIWT